MTGLASESVSKYLLILYLIYKRRINVYKGWRLHAEIPLFKRESVALHIRKHHPGCPDFAVEFFAAEVAARKWKKASLGRAVGIVMQSYLRHNMTDYETLLLNGVDRDEARRRVQPKINAMIAVWKREKPAD